MRLEKNVYDKLEAPWAEKNKDISNNDIVEISGDVKSLPNRFNPEKDQKAIKIKTINGDRYVSLNQESK